MSNIFTLENIDDFSEKINIDELYEKKRQHDVGKLELFNKILNRIHVRIKTTSRQKLDEHFCWFVVPEVIIGVPKYDQGACIAYIVDKLKTNGFQVKYIHPNTLLISWLHWVPSYVRNELKNKTGIIVNEYGEKLNDNDTDDSLPPLQNHATGETVNPLTKTPLPGKNYTPITSYKPLGNLVYANDLMNKLENKIH
jgi:Family of unknown function (DUF5759)